MPVLIVMNLHKGSVMLIFPNSAKVNDTTGFLEGEYKDGRRLVVFSDMKNVKAKEKNAQAVIKKWLKLVDN